MMKQLLIRTCFAVLLALFTSIGARASVTLNSTNFPDANFRNALAPYATNGVIDETTLTELDVSRVSTNLTITDLTGLQLLTGLTTLDISGQSTLATGANISNLTALRTLKASNCNISSLRNTLETGTHAGAGLLISSDLNIEYLDLSYNANFYYSGNLSHLHNLKILLLNNCTNYDYWETTPGSAMANLEWLDISHTKCDRIYLPNSTKLRHLKAAGTKLIGFSSGAGYSNTTPTAGYIQLPTNLATLEYLNLADCTSTLTSFRAMYDHYNISCLDTLILTNNTNLGWSNHGFEAQTGLTYLDVTNCKVSTAGPDYIPNFDHLNNIETLLYGENPNVGYLRLTGNPHLKTLDLHGNTSLTMLALVNCGLPRNDLSINDTNCPAFTGLKLNNNGYESIAQAMANASAWGVDTENIKLLYLENNIGFTGGPLTMGPDDCHGLTGIDLSNNGFTSFTAESLPSTLTALLLGKNPAMTRLEMHNNPGITTIAADTVMRDGSGLYLLGNTALHYMDISGTADQPNYFQRIGNNGSLNGVPIDTIKASYNKFYTFRNLVEVPGNVYEHWGWKDYSRPTATSPYTLVNRYTVDHDPDTGQAWRYKSYWPTMSAMPDSASLEQLPDLRYLDLSHCNLKDSVYLHKNTELRYLDVSHNRTIKPFTGSGDKGSAYRASLKPNEEFNRSFEDYKKYVWLTSNTDDIEHFTNDRNDTTGLYILDLMDNTKLEYLDISYTGIEQTAATHCHVANARYVWIQDLPYLKYFYANYNGMRSMGIGTLRGKHRSSTDADTEGLKSLERLSVIGMRGTDKTTMQGSINFRENTVCTKLHYINLAYSRFDSIGVYIPTVDTLIVKGNPLHKLNMQKVTNITYLDARECAFKLRGYDVETGDIFFPDANVYKNGAREGGDYSGAVTSSLSGLREVRAYERPYLTTVLLDNCNALRDVYCFKNPMLPKIHGFENLAYNKSWDAQYNLPTVDADSLNLVWVNDNTIFNELDLSKNDNLQYLHAYNDKALGTALGQNGMNLKENVNLVTAWVSNSNLQKFTNFDANRRANQENLDTLKIWQNPLLDHLDTDKHPNLRYLDLRNCMVRNLDVSGNAQLTYFDCSNLDSISAGWTAFNNYGYTMPRQVPTSMSEPGKNSIADLNFSSNALKVVHADNNDLYSLKGLANNPNLNTLTYSHNHICAIDLSGCPNISTYDCTHNVRGLIPGELSVWYTTENNVRTKHEMYYFQLKENAGDALQSGYNTFLGSKEAQDSIETESSTPPYMRSLTDDGFDPLMVDRFTVNSSGPYEGTRVREGSAPSGAPSRVTVDPSEDLVLDLSTIYGNIAVIKYMDPERNYVEYLYKDGRPGSSKDGGGRSAFGLAWGSPGVPTMIDETMADGLGEATVVSERYYDAAGIEHSEPIKGVNIVVRQMSDGSTQTIKVLK